MKLRPFIIGMLAGVLITAATAMAKLWSNNERWRREAYEHYAAVYTMNYRTGKTGWMWFDDYARTILFPKAKEKALKESGKYVPPVTPRPELYKL